jgi:hypothetical protein
MLCRLMATGLLAAGGLARAEAPGPTSTGAPVGGPPSAPAQSALPDPLLAQGEGGWRATTWGMTVEEVLKALPGEASRLTPEIKLADGNIVAAGIDRYTFETVTFQVRFIFTDGKLALVSLRTPQDRPSDGAAFERLSRALVQRWGPPMESTRDDNFIDQRQVRWARGRSLVDLKFIPGVIVILHHPAPGKDAPMGAASAKPAAQ